MSTDFDQILDECVDRINSGESIEKCLASYPEQAEELEPALRAIFDIRAACSFTPQPGAKAVAKQRFYAALDSLERNRQERHLTSSGLSCYIGVGRMKAKKAFGIIAAVSVLALLIVGLVVLLPLARQESVPIHPEPETGTLKLYLSDAPIDADNVAGVYIKINGIQYNLNGEWKTFENFGDPRTYNLLELAGGNFALLGEFGLPAGNYTQIRFILDIREEGTSANNTGCYIKFTDNTTAPLFVPSGGSSGYKAVGAFAVSVSGEVEVTADWDVRKGVVEAGHSGKYILKPTIRLTVNNQAGNIAGSITNGSAYEDIIVYAYGEGTWNDMEDDDPVGEDPRFSKAVTSSKMDKKSNYVLALLTAGKYDLVVAGFNGATFGEVLGFISNVEVESEQTTTQDIEIPLVPPARVGLVATPGNAKVTLDWADNTGADLAGYNVYRSEVSGGPYTKVATVTSSKCTDTRLINGTTYYYVVTAFDDSGNESSYSAEVSATPTS